MHISEGILSAPVLASGAALAAGMTVIGLRRLDPARMVRVGLLASAFYVASLVHVPIGPGNAHLVLNGLLGLLLGWVAVPAILTALLLQAVMFQFGGLTVLGVNTVIMAMPAVVCHYAFGPLVKRTGRTAALGAFAAGALAVLLSGTLVAIFLIFSGEQFLQAAWVILAAHVPIMLIEGLLTMFLVAFFKRAKPELLAL
ncbi:cobalt transporter CbiM [Desulfocurvibacter africanus]|uniref:cobalt transporter CbiM n=1 Tax=Desulfocurvibacter africanus TaxID=873 RepID=UPI0004216E56|nr:cobalt transporter CbiM [Desulfocurvibacter africanus]